MCTGKHADEQPAAGEVEMADLSFMVDTTLKAAEPIGTILKDGSKIFYAKMVQDTTATDPFVYYIVCEWEGAGTYYGFYTTGRNSMDEAMTLEAEELNPESILHPLLGYLVNFDGEVEPYVTHSPGALRADKLDAPEGTYYAVHVEPQYSITFNADGTGTVDGDSMHWTIDEAQNLRLHFEGESEDFVTKVYHAGQKWLIIYNVDANGVPQYTMLQKSPDGEGHTALLPRLGELIKNI